jgi:uncharacterized protein (DUF2062 family)
VPIYSFCYIIGHALVGGPGLDEMSQALTAVGDPELGWGDLARAWGGLMWRAAAPLWVGCMAVGLAAGAVGYVVIYYLILFHRRRRAAAHPEAAHGEGAAPDAGRPEDSGSGTP